MASLLMSMPLLKDFSLTFGTTAPRYWFYILPLFFPYICTLVLLVSVSHYARVGRPSSGLSFFLCFATPLISIGTKQGFSLPFFLFYHCFSPRLTSHMKSEHSRISMSVQLLRLCVLQRVRDSAVVRSNDEVRRSLCRGDRNF